MAFFGKYIEVIPHSRLVWTNDEGGDAGAVTTATFEEEAGTTVVVMHDLYPLKGPAATPMHDGRVPTRAARDGLLPSYGD